MLLDARSLPPGSHLDADIAIVGAGPAGITLAHELMDTGLTVLLLEAGGAKPDPRLDPFKGSVADPRHPPVSLYRVRALGGTTTLWGGRCIPLDPIDLEPRPWIPHSGWPIDWDELRPWYERALDYCEAGPFAFTTPEAFAAPVPLVDGLEGGELDDDTLERFSPPTDFGRRPPTSGAATGGRW